MNAIPYYVLELYVTEKGRAFYEKLFDGKDNILTRNNENAGFDLFCAEDVMISQETGVTMLDLGSRAKMYQVNHYEQDNGELMEVWVPQHFWLAPRSSIWKSGVTMANSMGIIDSSYRGVLMGAVLPYIKEVPIKISAGSRLFQILAPNMGHIQEIYLKSEANIDSSSRGSGGFGSTGN
jgi:dUTP pyrophosphatase